MAGRLFDIETVERMIPLTISFIEAGSPVLTRDLEAFAVHHRALYERQLNEGIVLNAVTTELRI